MDVIPRIQPTDPSALTYVDSSLLRMCASTVLVHNVTVRHLPAGVDKLKCAITIAVCGSTFTTPAVLADVEDEDEQLLTGATCNTTASLMSEGSSAGRVRSAVAQTFKMSFSGLNLLFPGSRQRASRMDAAAAEGIANPREFPLGVQVTVHSADRTHVFGSALCKTSGEAAGLSYPRGEASVSFRVYPCQNGVPIMTPLFNKACPASTYLRGAPMIAAALTDGSDVTAASADTAADGGEGQDCVADAAALTEEAGAGAEQVEEDHEETAPAGDTATTAIADASDPASTDAPEGEAIEEEAPSCDAAPMGTAAEVGVVTEATVHDRPVSEAQQLREALAELIPCYTEEKRKAAFALYEAQGTNGALTRGQVLHFIRSHEAYADACGDDEELLRWSLSPYVTKQEEMGTTAPATPAAEEAEQATDVATVAVEVEGQPRRLDPGHLYYHPSSSGKDAAKGDRADSRTPLEVNYELFSLIALKLAKA